MGDGQPLILSLDTATSTSSVALTKGNRTDGMVMAVLSISSNRTHSRRLLAAISFLMQETAVDWPHLDGIAICGGPGSFTGLRIGMATAKGLATASGKQLLAISTLDSLAARCTTDKLICSVLDARKKEVYAAFYRKIPGGLVERVVEPMVVAPEKLAASIDEPVLFVGDGIRVYKELFVSLLGDRAIFAPVSLYEPSAASLGFLAAESLQRGHFLDAATGVPLYLRSSDAELNLMKSKEKRAGKEVRKAIEI